MAWIGQRINPARHQWRWYRIDVQPTLWGDWRCLVAWGRIGQAARGQRILGEGPVEAMHRLAEQQQHRKRQRGYVFRIE
ncbi:WGR domain-containing protein [Sulfobacillus thermosulfidooxidans]|uniref:WGR domain-containing protein n=1 Tax=Sulfobacillus thermosulfidooxidans TaxID=28034 RepID=UPI0006B4EAF8|nr:WGR domain-containing protein [Sulfobacillus thermosulfidooxidans]